MISLSQRDTKTLTALHGWSGVLLGVLLYAVVVTGMLAVFAAEITTWSSGTVETRSALERPMDANIRARAAETPADLQEELFIFNTARNQLGLFFHKHVTHPDGTVGEEGILWEVADDGTVLDKRVGTDEAVFEPDTGSALGRFLVDLHVRLHLPNPWGLILTGILGLAMLLAAVTGLLIHRHLFKDMFTLRRNRGALLTARDRHNVAGTWSLPFAFLLAFTGCFFSFATSFGLPALAIVAFGGDQEAMFEKLVGAPPAADSRAAPVADLDAVIADSSRRAGQAPDYLFIGQYGRADANLEVTHPAPEGGLQATTFVYNGATGAFSKAKPVIGTEPSLGGTLYSLMVPLHFGHFAGTLSKTVWFALGFATCFVTATGMGLWLRRRERQDDPAVRTLDRGLNLVVHGLPLAIAASGVGYFMTLSQQSTTFWVPASFLLASGGAILLAFVTGDAARLGRLLQQITGVTLLLLPVLRLATGGPGWDAAILAGQWLIPAIDLAMAMGGLAMLWRVRQARAVAPRAAFPNAAMEPAE